MKPMLSHVLEDLSACKGGWTEIARELEPDNTVSFYSWLTKLAQGVIREPSVNRIQRLYDYFRNKEREVRGTSSGPAVLPVVPADAHPYPEPVHDDRRDGERRDGDRRVLAEQRQKDRRHVDRRDGV